MHVESTLIKGDILPSPKLYSFINLTNFHVPACIHEVFCSQLQTFTSATGGVQDISLSQDVDDVHKIRIKVTSLPGETDVVLSDFTVVGCWKAGK